MSIELPEEGLDEKFPQKKRGLPWKNYVLPVVFFLFCVTEATLLVFLESPKTLQIPAPIVQLNESPLPQPLCPQKIVEEEKTECPVGLNPVSLKENTLHIEKLAKQTENVKNLAQGFFEEGKIFAQKKEWKKAFMAFHSAFFYQEEADYAFNAGIALEYLKEKERAKDYYQKALTLAQKKPAQFLAGDLQRHLQNLEN